MIEEKAREKRSSRLKLDSQENDCVFLGIPSQYERRRPMLGKSK